MSKREIKRFQELRSLASFHRVQFYEVYGLIYGGYNVEDIKAAGTQEVDFNIVFFEAILAVRMRLTVHGDIGRYRTDVAAIFMLEEKEIEIPGSRTLQAFVKNEALPILYPFARQSLWDTSNRLAQEEILLESLDDDDLRLEKVMEKIFRSPPRKR